MAREDMDGDVRLRTSARASMARLEAEVDRQSAWREFNDRLNEGPRIEASPRGSRPSARRLVAAAVLLLLIAAAVTALVRRDGEPRTATVVPAPTDTTVEATSIVDDTLPATTGAASQAPEQLVALLGRTWVIAEVNDQPRSFAAYFEMESGKLVGHDGCNFYDETFQLEDTANGEMSLTLTFNGSTAAACAPPYVTGWTAPTGHYRVDGNSLVITADDGSMYEAVDLESLPAVTTSDEIIGQWSVPDGIGIDFADDGTIRLPCATIGTWTFDDTMHTTIDQTAAITNCTTPDLRSVGWTYDALLSGAPTVRRLVDGSLLFGSGGSGSTQLGHIVPATNAAVEPTASNGDLLRPFVDSTICAPLTASGDGTATGSTFDLHLFGWPTSAPSFPIQIVGDPNGGPTAPFALVQRYPDQTDSGVRPTIRINDWDVALQVGPNDHGVITGDARWKLADGGEGYVRSRGIDRDTLISIIASLTPRDAGAPIPGFEYSPPPSLGPALQLIVEHLNTGVYGRSATLQCQVVASNLLYRITTLDGDPVFQYALVIDRPVPLELGYQQGTLVVIEGVEDSTAPTVAEVFNTDVDTWNDLLANPRAAQNL
jgi:hypothetical protein